MKTPETVIKELELGYIPNELLFLSPEEQYEEVQIDWTALHYSEWDDFDFWCAKHLPEGLLEQWDCLRDWAYCEYESREKKTPLDEINERQELSCKKNL
jgi:hypothetical protein